MSGPPDLKKAPADGDTPAPFDPGRASHTSPTAEKKGCKIKRIGRSFGAWRGILNSTDGIYLLQMWTLTFIAVHAGIGHSFALLKCQGLSGSAASCGAKHAWQTTLRNNSAHNRNNHLCTCSDFFSVLIKHKINNGQTLTSSKDPFRDNHGWRASAAEASSF